MDTEAARRKELLSSIVELRDDWHAAVAELRQFPWDWEGEPLVLVRSRDVRRALGGYTGKEIAAETIETWAGALECRDDLEFETGAVKEAIHALSNPSLDGVLTDARVAELRASVVRADEALDRP